MRLGEALDAEGKRVEELQKAASELQKTLRAWHAACRDGALPARERASSRATELARELADPVADVAASWSFDLRAYLSTGAWRQELHEAAAEQGLAVLEEQEHLVSSPVTVRSQSSRGLLTIGRRSWSRLHPSRVITELKRLREGNQRRNAEETLAALRAVWVHQQRPPVLKFIAVYELFSLTPGWKRENPPVAFAQRLHGLHAAWERDGLRATRDGQPFQFEWPSGDVRERDLITFVADDGRPIRYYGIVFD